MAKRRPRASMSAGSLQPQSLNAAIAAAGAAWQAGQTPLSSLPPQERASYLGLAVSDQEISTTAKAISAAESLTAFAAVSLPTTVDWRNNGGNFVTSIKDQKACGSCVSFGTIATIEARINVACKRPGTAPDLSEAHLFYCGCGNCCGSGWNFTPALAFCQNTGTVLESCFPYTPGNQPCKQGCPIYTKITGYVTLLSSLDRKNAIASGGPVVAGMAVYQDFYNYVSGIYKHVTGSLAGYHCVSVIGYDDAQQCWIAKNSWNTGWGDQGFFRIAYGECGIDTQFAMYAPAVSCPGPHPVDDCTAAVEPLKRVLQAAGVNPRLRACLRYYVCQRGIRPPCGAVEIRIVRIVQAILTRCPQYRLPFCRALG